MCINCVRPVIEVLHYDSLCEIMFTELKNVLVEITVECSDTGELAIRNAVLAFWGGCRIVV